LRIVGGAGDVRLNSVSAGPGRRRRDARLIAAGEHDLMTGPGGQFDDGGANALTAAGDEKTGWLHE
jgi:hypothetical protein